MISPHCVMVVEDDEDIREAIHELLEESGFTVCTAVNGLDALAHLREGVRPSVILLDLMMPVMDGFQFVTEKLKNPAVADIPVLVITADGQADLKAKAIGAQGYVRKPFKPATLIEHIERIAGSAPSSTGV